MKTIKLIPTTGTTDELCEALNQLQATCDFDITTLREDEGYMVVDVQEFLADRDF